VPAGGAAGAERASRPWLGPHAARLDALQSLAPAARLARLERWARDADLRTESGWPIRFVAAEPAADPAGARRGPAADRPAYEQRVSGRGEVPTRLAPPGDRHDLLNALAWIEFPRAKARINALHAAAGGGGTAAARGPLRDALTLFDENGAVWLTTDASLTEALRRFDWRTLFVERRAVLAAAVGVRVFGHALLEKLDAPYKAITAHAWPLPLPPDAPSDAVDRALADSLQPGRLGPRAFCPLPVMGLPGWCDGNGDPAFYNDAAVFRPGRSGGAPLPHRRGD